MDSNKNIANAIQVLYKTYENVNKLMEYCKNIASDSGYACMTDKFLRWKSDSDYSGWLVDDFILLFQKESDNLMDNQWHDGAIYVMEICLGDVDDQNILPTVYLSKFMYKDVRSWAEGCSVSNHWKFYWPLRSEDKFLIEEKGEYVYSSPKDTKASETYGGITQVIYDCVELTSINVNNVREKIFGTFDKLDNIQM